MSNESGTISWLPDLIYSDGRFLASTALVVDNSGRIVRLAPEPPSDATRLKNKALLPGLVNAHSHAFQRVIRARTEYRTQNTDSFWTWRELMYRAANKLDVLDVYVASRMAFLEMALGGITTVGEFHYIHRSPGGDAYDDPNLLSKEVIRAANDVGLRIALLRVAYERSGFRQEPNPLQVRFIEDADTYIRNLERLIHDLGNESDLAWVGSAPHSVRAVGLPYLKQVNEAVKQRAIPLHMHVAEQPAEVSACIEEYGRSPVALLETENLLSRHFTAVHAIHVTPKAMGVLARSGTSVCACPTTERNLGDGVIPVADYLNAGVRVCLGTDSQIQIDLLEDARELEYHLRLQRRERNVLAPVEDSGHSALAHRLFEVATINGAQSLAFDGGRFTPGSPADFFTVDLDDPSLAGASTDDLLAHIIFSLSRAGTRDVVVGGKQIVVNGQHAAQDEIIEDFKKLQERLWN